MTKIVEVVRSTRLGVLLSVVPGASALLAYVCAGTGVVADKYLTSSRSLVPDSFDWLVNSQHINGPGTSVRLPVLPLLLRGVRSLNLSFVRYDIIGAIALFSSLTALGFIVFHLRQRRRAALATQAFFAVNATFVGFHQYVLADTVAVSLMLCGLALLLWKKELVGSLIIGIGGVTQYAILLVLAPLVVYLYLDSPLFSGAIKRSARCISLSLVPLLANLAWKKFSLGDPMYTGVNQLVLLNPSALGVPYYLVNTVGFLGLPGALMLYRSLRRHHRDPLALTQASAADRVLIGGSAALLGCFFVVFYGWLDRRFLLYSLPLVMVLAFSVIRIDRRRDHGLLAAALVFGSFSGSSAFAGDEIALLPGLQLQIAGIADRTDAKLPVPLSLRLRTTGSVGAGGSGLFASPRRLVDAAGIEAKLDDQSLCFAPFEVYVAKSLDRLRSSRERASFHVCP